jgi:MFS family permease
LKEPTKLFNKNFLLLWQGQFVSRFGNVIYFFAMNVWLTWTFDSALIVGLLGMFAGIPAVIFGVIGGTIADNFSRRKIIIMTDFLNGIISLTLAAMFFILPLTYTGSNQILLIAVFIVSILGATLNAFFGPAMDASIPDIVPKSTLVQANSMGQLSRQLAQFSGQGAGAALIEVLGAPVFILFNGFSFLFSAFSEFFIKIPQVIPEKSKNVKNQLKKFKTDMVEGFNYINKNKGLKNLVFVSIFTNFFTAPIIVLLTFYVKDILLMPKSWYGLLMISFAIGALIGYTSVAIINPHGSTRCKLIITFLVIQSAGYAVLGLIRIPSHAIFIMFIGGILNGFVLNNITTILQLTVPSNIRGRVFGLLTTISASAMPLGMGLSGVIGKLLDNNIPIIYVCTGVITAVLSIAISLNRDFREFISYETEEQKIPTGFYYNIKPIDASELHLDDHLKYKELV